MLARVFQEREVTSGLRHGAAQLERFESLPDSAWVTQYVAEMITGRSKASIERLRSAGILEWQRAGTRNVRIKVGSIRALLQGQR